MRSLRSKETLRKAASPHRNCGSGGVPDPETCRSPREGRRISFRTWHVSTAFAFLYVPAFSGQVHVGPVD